MGSPEMMQLVMIALLVLVFYFFLIRPQQKRMKKHQDMLSALRRGDRVVTSGGIIGTITKVIDDQEIQVEIADGVVVRIQKPTIVEVMSKTMPVDAANNGDDDAARKKSERKAS